MRRFLSYLLAVLCLLPAVTVCASPPDADLAQIMAGGEAVLEEVPFLSPSEPVTVRIPVALANAETFLPATAEPAYTDDGKWLTVTVNGSALPLEAGYSSPDGSKMLCPDGANLWLFEGDTLTLLSPDTARSVEDTYGSFERFLQSDTRQWVGAEGVTWSQDGHYAVLTNYKSVIQMVRMIYGLYVIDTQTGSILCLDTFPSKFGTGAASVLQACFDETGRILYAIVFGDTKNNYGDPVSLVRYDMETGKKQKLCGSEMIVGMPRLQADAQGRLWNLITPHSSAENGGLNLYAEADGQWTITQYTLPQPCAVMYPVSMELSADGTGLCLVQLNQSQNMNVQLPGIFRVTETGAAYQGLLTFDSLLAKEAQLLPFENYVNPDMAAAIFREGKPRCLNAKLSPDGSHALLLVTDGKEYAFLLLDMQTFALCRVQTPNGTASPYGAWNGASKQYAAGYTWVSGNRIAISTETGVRLFEITAP